MIKLPNSPFSGQPLQLSDPGFGTRDISPNPRVQNVLLAWKYKNFIADLILPPGKMDNRLFRLQLLNQGAFRIPDATSGPDGVVKEITIDASQESFEVIDRYLQHPLDRVKAREAGFGLQAAVAKFVFQNVKLIHEFEVATFLSSIANFDSGRTFDATSDGKTFTDPTADIVNYIWAGIESLDTAPNIMWSGQKVYRALSTNKQMLATIRGLFPSYNLLPTPAEAGSSLESPQSQQMASADAIAAYFGMEHYYVGREKYNKAAPGQPTDDTDFIWGANDALGFGYIIPMPTQFDLTFAACFSETLANSLSFFMPNPGVEGSDFQRNGWNRYLAIMNKRLAGLIINTL